MGSARTGRRQRVLRLACIALVAALSAVFVLEGSPRAAWALGELFVTNFSNESLTVYRRTASGNAAPRRTLKGTATGLSFPAGLAVDPVNNEVVVANLGAPSITVYSRDASGDAAPLRTISGPATGLAQPVGIALDPVNGEILVANTHSITVYDRTASGNVVPKRTITGGASGLVNPLGIAVDPVNNEVLVANLGDNAGDGAVTVYDRLADGNIAPKRTITGGATGLVNPLGIAVDPGNDEVLVTNLGDDAGADAAVTVYRRIANGNEGPLRTLSGVATGLVSPRGLAVDTVTNEVVVANLGATDNADNDAVTAYRRTANGNVGPLRPPLIGAATGLSGPAFVAVTRAACPLAFDFDFSDGEYADCFRELVRPDGISDGLDLGGTGHFAVNFKGSSGPTPSTWLTAYGAPPGNLDPGPTFGAETLCADVLIVPFNNTKGAGVVALLNEGVGKKGLALIIHDAGNTDALLLVTVDSKNGNPTAQRSKSLGFKISGTVWYRLIMTILEDKTTDPAKWTVTGKVFKHSTPTDPNSALSGQVGKLTHGPGPLPAGVTSPGQNGIVGSSISAVLNASVTNFSNDATRCMQ